jgi:predicted NBD/HSP70 family sugar kinase
MTPHGFSSPDLRKRNRAGILRLMHRHGSIARNDLAKELGLTRASVTYLINELLSDGLVAEGAASEADGRVGRRKIFMHIRSDAACVVGIGADSERLQIVLADLSGAVLGVRNLPSPSSNECDAMAIESALVMHVSQALAELTTEAHGAPVLGAGIVVTGRVDSDAGVSLREPRLWPGPVNLREPLERSLGVPVAVDNNVRALALAELLLTDAKASSPAGLLFVKYGPGVGAAWVVGGVSWPGAHFRSGELGHTLVENDGPPCAYCGRRGCLESLVSARALADTMGLRGGRVEDLCSMLEAHDHHAFATLATRFARAIGNAIEVCDPSVVTLYGAPFRSGTLFDEIAMRVESNERPCEIRRSGLDPDLPALGGAALALDKFFLGQGA